MNYIVYKTTNLINKRIYVGVHKQEDPHIFDGYLGSNRILLHSIKKHGAENFKRETVEIFSDMNEAYEMESMIVDESFVKRPDTYNLSPGGIGNCYLGRNSVDKGLGMHSPLLTKEDRTRILKEGQSKRDPEERLRNGRINGAKGGLRAKELKAGLFALPEEVRSEYNRKAGLIGGKAAFENKKGWYAISPEEKLENSSRGGQTQGRINRERSIGIFSLSAEERLANCKLAAQTSAKKRIGSKWYNDGVNRYKYYRDQQEELSFEDFLKQNPQFKAGTKL